MGVAPQSAILIYCTGFSQLLSWLGHIEWWEHFLRSDSWFCLDVQKHRHEMKKLQRATFGDISQVYMSVVMNGENIWAHVELRKSIFRLLRGLTWQSLFLYSVNVCGIKKEAGKERRNEKKGSCFINTIMLLHCLWKCCGKPGKIKGFVLVSYLLLSAQMILITFAVLVYVAEGKTQLFSDFCLWQEKYVPV